MIGYYVHHQGGGHAQRALAFARAWVESTDEPVTGLSSREAPAGWPGPWLRLARDDAGASGSPTAGGVLHWAPLGDRGLADRSATVSRWLMEAAPRVVVVDVSVEVTLLVRLHGVPVVGVVLPGRREDAAHLTGFRACSALVAAWPPSAAGAMTPGLPEDLRRRIRPVGAVSTLRRPSGRRPDPTGRPHVVVLQGSGGDALVDDDAEALGETLPGYRWTVLGGRGDWIPDPTDVLADADVVVTQAGQGSLADVAQLRRPAVVVPSVRPHEEQATTAAVLASGPWPVVVRATAREALAPEVLERARRLDPDAWADWCDGGGAARMVRVVAGVAGVAGVVVTAGAR